MLNNNSHRALNVGTLFPQKNMKEMRAVRKNKVIIKTEIVDQKTVFKKIIKKLKNSKNKK